MPYSNVLPSDRTRVLAVLDPASRAANTYTTGWLDMAAWDSLMAIIQVGALGANGTVDAKFQQATDGAGAGAKDVTGKAITQLTQAGTDHSNQQVLVNLFSDQLDVTNSFRYVRLSVTTATAASLLSAVVLGFDSNYYPAQATTVNETK
jgi:hypothetical protein